MLATPEEGIVFDSEQRQLVGVLHPCQQACIYGVLIIPGGPQYRVGSQRLFVSLARSLANQGTPCFRFDYTGMGDSEGVDQHFLRTGADIHAAISTFIKRAPIDKVIIWGLCDAASAALLYAYKDPRVARLILVNPWVRSETGLAKAYLKDYYLRRLASLAFWKKLLGHGVNFRSSLRGFINNLLQAFRPRTAPSPARAEAHSDTVDYIDEMLAGLELFDGRVLLITSGKDLTATEFKQLTTGSTRWQAALQRVLDQHTRIEQADHTFSNKTCRDQMIRLTAQWVDKSSPNP